MKTGDYISTKELNPSDLIQVASSPESTEDRVLSGVMKILFFITRGVDSESAIKPTQIRSPLDMAEVFDITISRENKIYYLYIDKALEGKGFYKFGKAGEKEAYGKIVDTICGIANGAIVSQAEGDVSLSVETLRNLQNPPQISILSNTSSTSLELIEKAVTEAAKRLGAGHEKTNTITI